MLRHHAALVSGKLTRVPSEVNFPPSEVIMSSAPSKAWRFLQGESPCGVRSHQPLLPSVAPVEEGEVSRTTQVKRTQGTT